MTITTILTTATEILRARGNRSHYARDVLRGWQNWSGSDLKGAAKKFGAGYAVERAAARSALFAAGGQLVPVDHGRLVAARHVGQDDFGNQIVETVDGTAIMGKRQNFHLI